jgi:hypothetical protein
MHARLSRTRDPLVVCGDLALIRRNDGDALARLISRVSDTS